MSYIDSLSEYERGHIWEEPVLYTFTFGDGRLVSFFILVVIPCHIGGGSATIRTDIVECNIPLLLSKWENEMGEDVY